jgi:hypothetical protein
MPEQLVFVGVGEEGGDGHRGPRLRTLATQP